MGLVRTCLRGGGLFIDQCLYMPRPKLKGRVNFLSVAVALIDSGHTGKRARTMVQSQLDDMRSDPEPL